MSPSQGGPPESRGPGGTDSIDAPAPGGQSSPSPAPAGELPAPLSTPPTPLLDAEIRRAEAVNRQHIESLKAADAPTPAVDPADPPPDRSATEPAPTTITEPKAADPDQDIVAPLPLAGSPRIALESETPRSPSGIVVPPLIPIDPSAAGSAPSGTVLPPESLATDSQGGPPNLIVAITDTRDISHRAEEPMPIRPESDLSEEPKVVAQQTGEDPSTSGGRPAGADREKRPPLEIAVMRLISRVKDFGSFEPVNPDTLKPGQRVRVYCEMTGLEYQTHGDIFVSRLAAHLELRSRTDGPVLWEQAPEIAKDLCHRPRRDYYVSYLVELPRTLEPGPYRLRLIQTDLVGNRATSSEIPVTIVR